MKKLRTSKRMMALGIVPGTIASFMLSFGLWVIAQFHIGIAVAMASGLSAFIIMVMYLISDRGISFDEEKFVVKGGREYYYHEIDEIRLKKPQVDFRRYDSITSASDTDIKCYKAIVVDGEEVCYYDDLYQNAGEFTAILEKHGFTVK